MLNKKAYIAEKGTVFSILLITREWLKTYVDEKGTIFLNPFSGRVTIHPCQPPPTWTHHCKKSLFSLQSTVFKQHMYYYDIIYIDYRGIVARMNIVMLT